ncbi:hypothetical protein M2447_002003 [Ereboglobus sp. PH5-10]|nr:hypothetical protein [Ereboglobus sp. PH5-10]MDF9827898.1 hypothetical protein [Ereboglobus sp. PH5-10]
MTNITKPNREAIIHEKMTMVSEQQYVDLKFTAHDNLRFRG